ncbi:bucentaur or craniofacial development-domain-containing protein [Syncephalastrum racemosum]|uniref:SWR1-complex protein 5 n=1 Tax=Syncephalastrum racemosum TaxID=13706 RepID=A0A1X2H0P8_SYNRA|nr:bucentaur or craniofacial development-domain-containing protein [Syncephalastrum racemosum]
MVDGRPKRLSATKTFSESDLQPDPAESWSDSEQDEDYTPDQDNLSEDDDDDDNNDADLSEHDESIPQQSMRGRGIKRPAIKTTEAEDQGVKRVKEDTKDPQAELDRKARIDAIWAEMNQKDDKKDKKRIDDKQPLDDISSSENQATSESPCQQSKEKSADCSSSSSKNIIATTTTSSSVAPLAQETQRKKKPGIIRPKSSLSALASHYNVKVPKMNTLEKSRLDWKGYVKQEGIQDELKYQNEDSYTDKVAFLQRVDDRRLSHIRAGRKASRKP